MAFIFGLLAVLVIGLLIVIRYGHVFFDNPPVVRPVALVCGGDGGLDAAGTIELYYPAAADQPARFGNGGNLAQARRSHTATKLNDGKILIAGGDSGTALAAAELYDPATQTSTAIDAQMKHARAFHTATLLDDGKVLLVGGVSPAGASVGRGERYLPDSTSFDSTIGHLQHARHNHVAIKLQDGQVLITGGQADDGTILNDAEIYNPLTQAFTLLGNSMQSQRVGHAMALLFNGQVLIAGGVSAADGTSVASAEIFDPANQTFTSVTKLMNQPRANLSATTLNNGNVLIGGGLNYSPDAQASAGAILDSAELFTVPSGAAATQGTFATVPGGMGSQGELHTATLLASGDVLLAGGQNPSGAIATAVIYHSDSNSFTATASMNQSRQLHAASAL
jgi:hypothetical protein